MPTVESWLTAAMADAERRGLTPLKALLETLARSTTSLRAAALEHRAATETPAKGPRS